MKNTNKIEVPLLQHAASPTEAVITMSSLGNLGRFGNQIFQYAFLKICAQESGSRVECSPWIGQTLFGHNDPPISKRLPPAIERWDVGKIVFDIVPEAIFYIEKQAGAQSYRVGAEALEHGLANVDLWGFFQVHTRFLRPYKNYFQSLFQPVSELRSPLEDALSFIRSKGRTVIGIHIRRKDFITSPQIGFTLVVPSSWWCDWLDENWSKFESPVLFLCSDDLDSIIDEFKRFGSIELNMLM